MAGKNFNVKVDGLAQLDQTDANMQRAQAQYLERGGERIRERLVEATPRRTGAMARAWTKAVDAPLQVAIVNTSDGAKARDRGAYIRPKRRTVLRFVTKDGSVVFTDQPVRQEATKFTQKALRPRTRIMREEFVRAIDAANRGSVV